MAHPALTVLVGTASGVLSGAFGIGGGLVTTPAIRVLLGYSALIAVGTPLPVILPAALAGAVSYARRDLVDVRAASIMGAVGAAGSVVGAGFTHLAGGSAVMLATAALIAWVAADMALHARRMASADLSVSSDETVADHAGPACSTTAEPGWRLAAIGVVTGLYSGFLGLGGGFIIVPVLTRLLRWPLKRAIGTSLMTVAALAVPGTVAHYLLGNVDVPLALLLSAGAVPGAILGARLTAKASDRTVVLSFAVLLTVTAVVLGATEIAGLVR